MNENYITIKNSVEVAEYIEKSKFISHAFTVSSEKEAVERINVIKKAHYKATHNVYSYVIGGNKEIQKSTDDGEPSGTAGVPVLEIIKKENVTNVLIVVTRYFGGIKLGAGGLIRAYAHMAKLALDQSEKIIRLICNSVGISISYPHWGKVENYLNNNRNIYISSIDYADRVSISVYVQDEYKNIFLNAINEITYGNVRIEELGKDHVSLPFPL